MFTGLIESIGTVKRVAPKGNYREITIVPDPSFADLIGGESIAVSGPCLTVVGFDEKSFTVEASQETIRLTTLKNLRQGQKVNLERAVKADARMGGHFVSGHIDSTLSIKRVEKIGKSLRLTIDLPDEYSPYIVDKGSVALNGVSLTVSELGKSGFKVNMIPETQKRTTSADLKAGDLINVEFDMIGKYILRFLEQKRDGTGISIESMRNMGY
jgi:riboflavin synthase